MYYEQTFRSILVANNYPESLGESEIYTYALAEGLKNSVFEVDYFTFHKGIVSDQSEQKPGILFIKQYSWFRSGIIYPC